MSAIPHKEKQIYEYIAARQGVSARQAAQVLGIPRSEINRLLYGSGLLGELCWKDRDDRWHALVRQSRPHDGLFEFCGYYGTISDFLRLSEAEWMAAMKLGCDRVGRSLSDKRGLFHSFSDTRDIMVQTFEAMENAVRPDWEIVFELRLKQSRYLRIYADVLVLTEREAFSLEFKMKDRPIPEEISQAGKYRQDIEILLGSDYQVSCALVLTKSGERFGKTRLSDGSTVYITSGDMLFNVFDARLHFLDDP